MRKYLGEKGRAGVSHKIFDGDPKKSLLAQMADDVHIIHTVKVKLKRKTGRVDDLINIPDALGNTEG